MLKKINRISSKKEFEEVKKLGVIKQYPYFGLIGINPSPASRDLPLKKGEQQKLNLNPSPPQLRGYLPLKKGEQQDVKFGFIISKKISKKAVVRNKIKRLLAEEVKKNLDKFENGFRGIFLIKKNIIDEKGNLKDIKLL